MCCTNHFNFVYGKFIYSSISTTVTECIDGTYGYNCINNCSGHCLGDYPCNKQTGHCDRGCNPGYTNMDCSKGRFTQNMLNLFKILVTLKHKLLNISLFLY